MIGNVVVIDGSRSEQVGALCPSVFLAAGASGKVDGAALQFINLSFNPIAGSVFLGIRPQHLTDREMSQ
jgi:hypothetical protein